MKKIIEDSLSHTKKVTITVKYIKLRLYYSYVTTKIYSIKLIKIKTCKSFQNNNSAYHNSNNFLNIYIFLQRYKNSYKIDF